MMYVKYTNETTQKPIIYCPSPSRLGLTIFWMLSWFTIFITMIILSDVNVRYSGTTKGPPNVPKPATIPKVTEKIFTEGIFNKNEAQNLMMVKAELSSFPIDCFKYSFQAEHTNRRCAPFPYLPGIKFDNTYWQVIHDNVTNTKFLLYTAYDSGKDIRLLGVHNWSQLHMQLYCQMWFNNSSPPSVVKITKYTNLWREMGRKDSEYQWQPYILTIDLPKHRKMGPPPVALALTLNPCDRANTLLTVYQKPLLPKQDFAVCLSTLKFTHEDLSQRFVIWLETLRLLGVQHVFVYYLNVHPNMLRVLNYYKRHGNVTVTSTTLPGGQPNLPSLQQLYLEQKYSARLQTELVHLNDCLYRSMHRYRWLVSLELDEVIMPLIDEDWYGLIKRLEGLHRSQYIIPPSCSSYNISNNRNKIEKAFQNTERVLAAHSGGPMVCRGDCITYSVPPNIAQTMKFEDRTLLQVCYEQREYTRNEELFKLCQQLIVRVEAVFKNLN